MRPRRSDPRIRSLPMPHEFRPTPTALALGGLAFLLAGIGVGYLLAEAL